MAAQVKNVQELEKARKLNHIPWCEEYEKMISGMLYVVFSRLDKFIASNIDGCHKILQPIPDHN